MNHFSNKNQSNQFINLLLKIIIIRQIYIYIYIYNYYSSKNKHFLLLQKYRERKNR